MRSNSLPAAVTDNIPAVPEGVHVTTLENGLTIIIREDHSAPVVSAQAWCMTGSVHEADRLGSGLSHLLEHMMFKGTITRPGSRIDQEIQEAGGSMNAYTSFDRTVYHIDVPNTGWGVAVDVLCDMMQNASLPEDELAKEMQVIVREMDMNVDDPGRRSTRRLFETAYTRSPYRFTIIGYPDLFHDLQHQDVVRYYRQRYAPNNLFFVLVGDLETAVVLERIRAAFQSAKARSQPTIILPQEGMQTAEREVMEEAATELAHVHLAWHIPEARHPDVPMLDVVSALLAGGRSSRLYRAIREKGLAHSVDSWTYNPGDPGLFGISLTLDPGQYVSARAAISSEIQKLAAELVGEAELQKIIRQFIAGSLSTRKTMQGQAQTLGSNWIMARDLSFSDRYLAIAKRATPCDLREVVQRYIRPENQTTFALMPKGTVPSNLTVSKSFRSTPIFKTLLSNGLRLLVKEDHRLPFVEFRAAFRGGVLSENVGTNGLTNLMSRMLVKGTQSRSAEQIADEIESCGGSINSFSGNNSFGLHAEVLSSEFETGFDVFADTLLNPSFPVHALERERDVQLAAIRSQKDQLLQSAIKLMRSQIFGPAGYGLDLLGTEESVRIFSRDQVKNCHTLFAVPNNCVMAIYGDVSASKVQELVETRLTNWSSAILPDLVHSKSSSVHAVNNRHEFRDKKQAVVVAGFIGGKIDSPDRYALELLQESCSDLGSRLFLRIREELGLAYYVGALNFLGIIPGYFCFYAGTAGEKADLVEKEILAEVSALRDRGLSEAELRRAKAKIIGQNKISTQDLGSLASTTALDELYGLGFSHHEQLEERYLSITSDKIREVANRYLRKESMAVAKLLPEL